MRPVKTDAPRKHHDTPLTAGDVQKILVFCESRLPRRIFNRCDMLSEAMLHLSVSDMLTLLEQLGYTEIQR